MVDSRSIGLSCLSLVAGEEVEYANTVKYQEATVFVESGRYFEDFPIKVPQNTSIKGDEFRRCIISPNDRSSQSPWANTYFYRDYLFDNLTGSANSSKAEGWATIYADTTFAIYTYAYDVSGITDVQVKVRVHTNKRADAKDKTFKLYNTK